MRRSDAPKSTDKEKKECLRSSVWLPVDVGILEEERKAWGKPMRLGTS